MKELKVYIDELDEEEKTPIQIGTEHISCYRHIY